MKLDVTLNGAEADALQQILSRHAGVLDKFEKNLLSSVARKVGHARAERRRAGDESWRRFVLTADDITIVKPSEQSGGRCACECHPALRRPAVSSGARWCAECVGDRAWLGDLPFAWGDDPPAD